MPCNFPLKAYFSKTVNPTGRRSLVFKPELSLNGVPQQIPCGQCMGCKLEKARQWAVRLMHEKKMHESSVFLTLTYDDAHVPKGYTLVKRDLQLFLKRLRKIKGSGLKFFACGEYGETTLRPHYHVILFGTHFPDMKLFKKSGNYPLYASAELDGIWMNGFCTIGQVDFHSCAYVSGYVTKKITGEKAEAHYRGRLPEFCVMSRGGRVGKGLSYGYFEKFGDDAYKHDNVIVNGHESPLPRYYDKHYEIVDFKRLELLKSQRRIEAKRKKLTARRRRDIEAFLIAKRRFFKKGQI